MAKIDWSTITWEQLKRSQELQKKYEIEFNLPALEAEAYWIKENDYHGQYVYGGFDPNINNYDNIEPNIRLLGEICKSEYSNLHLKPRTHDKISCFRNLTRLQISLLISELLGYRYYQIERILNIPSSKIKNEIDIAIQSIVKFGVRRCGTCKWRKARSKRARKKDFCKFWKVKVRNRSYCWLYKGCD